jgi:hypothetical protein
LLHLNHVGLKISIGSFTEPNLFVCNPTVH